ncbi:V/A-type H+-transporting ATPase subunit D [Crossiella equi]|uniref:V/A-type H+-transporting ATPase subunit D n=1 Tax=Crossiella equi TaxID=130796 RepID=A0ABS5AQJ3_9PSEU|nr:V-type ATP synthase subunit D [Crossiella equi]MBP2478845.1 V/A-type H+-transporting ATPase subunit D [Crossiella equi]
MTVRVPPGRAGRLWLRRRLATAVRATTVLERKLRTLRQEEHRLGRRARHTAERWREASAEADLWLLRSALAGGQRAVRLATTGDLAEVTITWADLLGVRCPAAGTVTPPHRPAGAAVAGGGALVRAELACREALEAAVRHAVAAEALRLVRREVGTTRQRVRALDRHCIPELRAAAARLELALEEQERAEGLARGRARGGAGTSR